MKRKKRIKIKYIDNKEKFEQLNNEKKTEEYFKLVDQIKKISEPDKPNKNSTNSSISPYTDYTRSEKNYKPNNKGGAPDRKSVV